MKKLLMVGILSLAATASFAAPMLTAGTSELGVNGGLTAATYGGTEFQLGASYGYFASDYLAVGLKASADINSSARLITFGPYVQYSWDVMAIDNLVPYGGIALLYANGHNKGATAEDSTKNAGLLEAEVGYKYFLSDSVALNLGLVGDVGTTDIFPYKNTYKRFNVQLLLGLKASF